MGIHCPESKYDAKRPNTVQQSRAQSALELAHKRSSKKAGDVKQPEM